MGTPKRSKIERSAIKSGGGDLRIKNQWDTKAQERGNKRIAKRFGK